jgi:capsular polysaccharide export protein
MSNKVALFHVISIEEITFYKRFLDVLYKEYKLKPLFITTSLFCHLYLKFNRLDSYLVYKSKDLECSNHLNYESFNEKVKWLSPLQAYNCYEGTKTTLKKIIDRFDVSIAFIPSGRLISHEATKDICREVGIYTVFSGYGNFPGKSFFDPEGTDKASSLFRLKNKISQFDFDNQSFELWRKEYLNKKLKSHIVAQARKVSYKTYISRFVRIVFCKLEKLFNVAHDVDRGWDAILDLKGGEVSKLISHHELPEKYILFPLQYSLDAQIILNYSGTYESCLDSALIIAKEIGYPLVIKPHPVENSEYAIDYVKNFVEKNNDVFISNENTFLLIDKSEKVITVNSTVGLESKLMRKNVNFLGDSIYESMTYNDCAKYLQSYLVDIDYFDKSNITSQQINKILKLCEIKLD